MLPHVYLLLLMLNTIIAMTSIHKTKYIEYKVATAVANNANRFQVRTARFIFKDLKVEDKSNFIGS